MFVGPVAPEHRQTANKRIAAYLSCVSVSFLAALLLSFHGGLQAPKNSPAERGISAVGPEIQPKLLASYGKLPLGFEANQGQTDPQVKFLSRGRGYSLFLTGDAAVLELQGSGFRIQDSGPGAKPFRARSALQRTTGHGQRTTDHGPRTTGSVLRMKLVGANAKATVTGAEELPGKSNYFIGNDPKKWRTNVPTYAKVRYENVHPGIDLVYYGNQGGQLEYDFVVAPGADPGAITLDVGAGLVPAPHRAGRPQGSPLRITPDGDLVITAEGGEIRFHKPVVYQEQSTVDSSQLTAQDDRRESKGVNRQSTIVNRQFREGRFHLTATNQVSFEVSGYDRTRPLVIDPVLSYSTYLGGSVADSGKGIAVDSSGNAYVTGVTSSPDFPTTNAFQPTYGGGGSDAFVVKLNATGSALIYSTYLGGPSNDWGSGIAVDSSGDAYVVGVASVGFPTANAISQTVLEGGVSTTYDGSACGGWGKAFVAELNPTGSALVYSTCLGGTGMGIPVEGNVGDYGRSIAVDSSGNAYITGYAYSFNFPVTPGAFQTGFSSLCEYCSDNFVAKVSWNGSAASLAYSTFFAYGDIWGIAADSSGNAYLVGSTNLTSFPTVNPLQPSYNGNGDAFVSKLNPSGSALVYSTYLGGSNTDVAYGIAVDSSGDAYVTGQTFSTNFPTVNPLQATNNAAANGGSNAFVAELDAAGSALVYSTYLGGSENDGGNGIAVDSSGNAYVVGGAGSPDFPAVNPLQPNSCAAGGVFVGQLNPTGSALVYSSCLANGSASAIAADSSGNAYITGTTTSTAFPTVNPLQGSNNAANGTAFVAKLSPGPAPAVSFSANAVNFGLISTGSQKSVTLTNLGNALLSITGITASSGNFALVTTATSCPYSGGTVVPGANCTLDVKFTPTGIGEHATGTVTVTDNAPGSPHIVQLSGIGVLTISVSPASLSFNSQLVGTTSAAQPVTVANTSNWALVFITIATTSGWIEGDNCLPSLAPGANCTINVSFQPTVGAPYTGTLTLTDNASNSPQTVSLSGTGILTVNVSPTSLSFGNQLVGTTSTAEPVTVANTASGALTISSVIISSAWTQSNNCLPSVAANSSCTINVSFQPTGGGYQTGMLTLTDSATNSPQTVALSGTALAPTVSLSATSLSFSAQPISTTSPPQTVTVSNTGNGTLTPLTIAISGNFAQTNTCGSSVAAGAGCTISVTFTPTAPGSRTGTLSLTDNAGTSPQTVSLIGAGLGAVASLSPSSLAFASQLVGTASTAQPVTLLNAGNQAMSITSISLTGAGSVDFSLSHNCPTSLAVNASCLINVAFTPVAGGALSASLSITDNASGSPQQVTLSGTGVAVWQQMPGLLSQISVGSDGTVWGINSIGQTYMLNPFTQTWQQAPILFAQIAVGSQSFVWALNAAGQVYRYDPILESWDQIPGTLSQIAVGSDGDVWGINSSGQIYHFNPTTQTWTAIPGALAQIAVGYDGAIWGINAAQQIYRFNPGTQSWQQIPGALKRVAVGADGDVWGINNAGQIYHFNTLRQQWDNAPGSLAQIAVGSASNVWGINAAGAIWRFNAQTQTWNQIQGQLAQIGVGANGAVWGLNSADQIYQFVQPTVLTPTWHQAPGFFARIAAGLDGEVWAIDYSQQVWRYDPQLQNWDQIPGALSQISVGFGGNVWGLNAAGQILQFNPSTQTWNQIPGSLAQLAVGADGSVWGLDSAGRIWRFNPSTQSFAQIQGTMAQLAVGADGTVWAVDSADQIWHFNPATQSWQQIPGSLAQIAVGSANNVWGINAAGQIWRYDPELETWDSMPGGPTSLAVAFDGTVWGLNIENQIWIFDAQAQIWISMPGALAQVSVPADAVVWGLNRLGAAYQWW
jgi:hypothetical protein